MAVLVIPPRAQLVFEVMRYMQRRDEVCFADGFEDDDTRPGLPAAYVGTGVPICIELLTLLEVERNDAGAIVGGRARAECDEAAVVDFSLRVMNGLRYFHVTQALGFSRKRDDAIVIIGFAPVPG